MSLIESFCDNCKEMIVLLSKYDECQTSEDPDGHILERDDLNLLINYMNNWSTKHCTCCYKDQKNFTRFNNLVQSVIIKSFHFLNTIITKESKYSLFFEDWSNEDKERLLLLLSKVIFQKNF